LTALIIKRASQHLWKSGNLDLMADRTTTRWG
jgi:hypothetical protein